MYIEHILPFLTLQLAYENAKHGISGCESSGIATRYAVFRKAECRLLQCRR